MATKRRKALPKIREGISLKWKLIILLNAFFLIGFAYLYQSHKVREMLIEEQALLTEINRLEEENEQLELDIANLCSLESLQERIEDSQFGFPKPNEIVHLHWIEDERKENGSFFKQTSDLVLNWIRNALDTKQPTYADSVKQTE
ncbi:MAG: hypothetical protein GF315_00025 [candidate division Zixibacteria bacterium]|nr:hypothetical protein [candidate division Zixibacteria bacterium]